MKKWIKTNNKGMGTIEIILIIVVLIALVMIFKTQMTGIVTNVFNNITGEVNSF